jgi:hypothetical protein
MKSLGFVGLAFAVLLRAGAVVACDDDTAPRHGQQAYLDPETGEFGAPPADALGPVEGGRAATTLPPVVELAPTDAGGVMIDLRGRYLYARKATLTPDGQVVTECVRRNE